MPSVFWYSYGPPGETHAKCLLGLVWSTRRGTYAKCLATLVKTMQYFDIISQYVAIIVLSSAFDNGRVEYTMIDTQFIILFNGNSSKMTLHLIDRPIYYLNK